MVVVKLVVLTFFIVVALANFKAGNLQPFLPNGFHGVTAAAAIIFFAYIGFDAVSTGSEEARNPAKDLPFAVIGSLLICTLFYVLTAVGALGIATPEQMKDSDAPLATALDEGAGLCWAACDPRPGCARSPSPAWSWSSSTARPASSSRWP